MATTSTLAVASGLAVAARSAGSCREPRQTTAAVPAGGADIGSPWSICGNQLRRSWRQESNHGRLVASVAAPVEVDTSNYKLPTWSAFEMGRCPVYWETADGRPPQSGAELSIYFNPINTNLNPQNDYGVGFNGGFNQPIMCGGAPRGMYKRDRGPSCSPIYSIRVNIPVHAITLEFSFTDGREWHGPYKLEFEIPARFRNQPKSFFNKALAEELSGDGCERAIFPDKVPILDRCIMPAGTFHEGGDRCSLDLVPGCMDPTSSSYNPLATVDDGSCEVDF